MKNILIAFLVLLLAFACSQKTEEPAKSPAASGTEQPDTGMPAAPAADSGSGDTGSGDTGSSDADSGSGDVASQGDASANMENGDASASGDMSPNKPDATAMADTAASADSNKAIMDLARASGCLACHAIDKKVVGPPWKSVADRYKGKPEVRDRLIAKVKAGGRGNWTEVVGNVAMPPYSPRASEDNIGKLVDFILQLSQ